MYENIVIATPITALTMSFFAFVTFSSEPPAVIQISPPATIKTRKITPTKEIIVVITVPIRSEIGVLERPVPSNVLVRPLRIEGEVVGEVVSVPAGGVVVPAGGVEGAGGQH